MNIGNERVYSVIILDKVNNNSGYSNELINNINNDELNRNFIREIVYGVLENKVLIDHILFSSLKSPRKKMNKKLIEIFNISIYQLLFMNKVPEYAVISEALNTADYFELEKYKGLLNAVLRNINTINIYEYLKDVKDKDKRIKLEFSVSDYFYEMLKKEYKFKTIKNILESYNAKSEFIIRINNIYSNIENVKKALDRNHIFYKNHPVLDNSLIIENPSSIFELEEFKNGYFTVQDGGSTLVAKILSPKKNSKVLDLCASPGSKTCYLSEIMDNSGEILANDIHKNKLNKIVENATRLGCNNIKTTNFDGTLENKEYFNTFDYILVDAPCSGSGIVSRKPEIKIYRNKEEVSTLIETQRKLVVNASKYLKKDGVLVYSTCSIFREENEEQLNWFLENTNLKLEKVNYCNKNLDYIKLMPYELGYNGFFICKLKK